ncbi:MDIS1-interacting receptor like kinase 1-like [Miscanthus floridulus]|uniref:MDIS1-interacting receptor like kinase 1-like n=1 Tax=Miscanthus floridulus TaxID=154761 RepID=UPI003458B5E8
MEARAPVLVLAVTLSLILASTGVGAAAGDERAALLALKAGFVDSLGALADWKGSSHCSWTAVGCNAAGLVDRLNLSGKNLSGKVTDDVLRLPSAAPTSPSPSSPDPTATSRQSTGTR